MGTRSLTLVNDERGKAIVNMYRQMDGYPSGHGAELKEFLAPAVVVNGYNSATPAIAFNGINCLAASLVCHFKMDDGKPTIGNFYLYPPNARDIGEEYIYTISLSKTNGRTDGKAIHLKVQAGDVTFFGLPGTKQKHMPVIYDGPIVDFNPDEAELVYAGLVADIPNDFLEAQQAKAK